MKYKLTFNTNNNEYCITSDDDKSIKIVWLTLSKHGYNCNCYFEGRLVNWFEF